MSNLSGGLIYPSERERERERERARGGVAPVAPAARRSSVGWNARHVTGPVIKSNLSENDETPQAESSGIERN